MKEYIPVFCFMILGAITIIGGSVYCFLTVDEGRLFFILTATTAILPIYFACELGYAIFNSRDKE